MHYRKLTEHEITTLKLQGCSADNWADVAVKEGFKTDPIQNVAFEGKIRLGLCGGDIDVERGLKRPSGLFNCRIRQCEIDDHVLIMNVGQVSNYIIESHVTIENSGSIAVHPETAFGNGIEIEVLNETGGRELVIFDRLSAQLAYLQIFYRHIPEFTDRLKLLIQEEVSSKHFEKGRIGSCTSIQHTGVIHNVMIGSHAVITGARLLEEGTVISNKHAPVKIGESVIAKKFIILSGSSVTGGANIEKCFIGQGVTIGKQYSAENSAFFANTDVALGEACSIFAGPYTVTHHKSTLLVAGLFSFYNGGSGTNISNHMYKLGPVHQGIVERGSKTGSSSYLLWPSRIGAYNVVVGKHYTNFDTTDFPFSYLVEEKGKSVLYPAMNLFTVGTRRDSEKWPARDKRNDPEKFDLISFDLFNPYLGNRMANAVRWLDEFAEKAQKSQEFVGFKGVHIPRLLLKTTRKFYEMALKIYIGDEVVDKLEACGEELTRSKVKEILATKGEQGRNDWRDIAGMLAPAEEIEDLIKAIITGTLNSVELIQGKFREIHDRYKQYAWNWCCAKMLSDNGEEMEGISRERLIQLIEEWRINAIKLNNMILQDATKEFDLTSRYGYGIDGDEKIMNLDFEAVRGAYPENKFVKSLKAENETIEKRAAGLIKAIRAWTD